MPARKGESAATALPDGSSTSYFESLRNLVGSANEVEMAFVVGAAASLAHRSRRRAFAAMKPSSRSIWGWVKLYPIFALFIASYTVIHLMFEYNFWFTSGEAIFDKYAVATDGNALHVAQKVYFAKATWMFAFVWLLVLRHPLRAAITYSFLLYSIELLLLFEPRPYFALNLLLALGLLVELRLKPAKE